MNLNAWFLAIRPRTLPAAIGPLLLGNVLAYVDGIFTVWVAISSMLCGILLQVGVNLANDYFDFKSGVDTDERLGPVRVTQSGLLEPTSVRNGMALSLLLAVAVGLYLIVVGGPIVACLAVFAVLGALCYSGGPYPLASHGLGEVAAFVFFGLVAVVGSYFTHAQTSTPEVWMLACTMGLLNAAIMLVNNTRDIKTDVKAGKRTLAVRLGQDNSRLLYSALLALPYLILMLMFLLGFLPGLVVILGFISVPMARMLAQEFQQSEGAELNPLLGRTAKLTMVYSMLLSVGLPLSQLS